MDASGRQPGVARSNDTVNVARFLPAMAHTHPATLALRVPLGRAPDGSLRWIDLTFAELDRECDAWCRRLTAAGVAPGTRVLLLVTPGLPLIAICFALFKIGAVPVVIDPGMGRQAFLQCVARSRPEALIAILRGIVVSRVFRRAFASVRIRLRVNPRNRLARANEDIAPFPVAPTRIDDLAAVLFTSGSTGAPKGVRYEHGMFEAQVTTIRDTYQIEPGEVDLPLLPIFALFNPALGMTTVVPKVDPRRPASLDPALIVQAIRECGVTNSFGAPVLWRKIGDYCLQHDVTLPSVRRILMAGAPVPPQVMADFRKILAHGTVHSPYGATEALPVTTISDREVLDFAAAQTARGAGTCVGRAVAGASVQVIELTDEPIEQLDGVRPAALGEVGEIIVSGDQVTRSYDALPEATRAAKITDADGRIWHRMGDVGYFDADGRLWFCGRKAECVTTRDGVLFTERCEPIFNAHPAVARSALIGHGPSGAQTAVIVIEPQPGKFPGSDAERRKFAAQLRALGRQCVFTATIQHFHFHRRFPVDVRHNAKIHRLRLARHFADKPPVVIP